MPVERILCESCGEREATIHFTEIVGNEKKETHLCAECHRQKLLPAQSTVTLTELLTALLNQVQQADLGALKKLACRACGMSYAEFQGSGRLGCPMDYEAFRKPLVEILERIQDDTHHIGRVPASADKALARHNELLRLRRELERAVLQENYEKARELRDEMAHYQGTSDEKDQGDK
jgi:protein arginine kinase activator